jgi:hypothetical protein
MSNSWYTTAHPLFLLLLLEKIKYHPTLYATLSSSVHIVDGTIIGPHSSSRPIAPPGDFYLTHAERPDFGIVMIDRSTKKLT